jgi:hypothetical protein
MSSPPPPGAGPALGIDYFGRGHWLTALQTRLSLGARRRMFERFREFAGPLHGATVLDVGATPDLERADSNCMLPWFHEAGLAVSLHSPEDVGHLRDVFPFVTLLPRAAAGSSIPAPAGSFDWVSASAVLEHVGGAEHQAEFIRECARVGRGLFLTTPDRGHWLEFHTKLPLVHWLPRPAHRALLRALGKRPWDSQDHLHLMSRRDLARAAAQALEPGFRWTIRRVWALGMPSNLVLLARRVEG